MAPRICVDRPLPLNRQSAAAERAVALRSDNAAVEIPSLGATGLVAPSMAIVTARRWPLGQELRVGFVNGSEWQKSTVASTAVEWARHAHLTFQFDADPAAAEIKVVFVADGDSTSLLGTDALDDSVEGPTMQFGWVDEDVDEAEVRAVILHEFGHALACIHEHQNPEGGIQWDKERVYADYATLDPPWSRERVDHNLFKTYERDLTKFSAFDPASVMLYPILEEHTLNDFAVGMNSVLSDGDRAFIGLVYPQTISSVALPINGTEVTAEASPEEKFDLFLLDIDSAAEYEVALTGDTNATITLYGPDNPGRLVASDSDSGREGYNARLRTVLIPGQYRLAVRHGRGGSGNYSVSAAPAVKT